MQFDPDLLSFLAGFIVGILFVWLVSRVRPLLKQMNESIGVRRIANVI